MSDSGSWEYEDEDEWESEYTTESEQPAAAIAATSGTPTAKMPLSVVKDSRSSLQTAVPHNSANSTMAGKPSLPLAEEDSYESWEEEEEWESYTSDSSVRVAPAAAAGGAMRVAQPAVEASSSYEEYEEYESEEYTSETSESVNASGNLWELVSSALVQTHFVTLVQGMFSGDSVAKSVIARDAVALTTPTRHSLTLLRNAVRSELGQKKFSQVGSFYQDILYHTLVRAGSTFFRQSLAPTVKALSSVTTDYELNASQVAPDKLEANQKELRRIADGLFEDLFSNSSSVPRLMRCALWVALDECRKVSDGDTLLTQFVATSILGRLLADPTGSKMTPSVSRVALANLGRISKIVSATVVKDASLGSFFDDWCVKQQARLHQWVRDMAQDPSHHDWSLELTPMGGLPQKEKDLVARFSTEISTLRQWLVTGQKERAGGLTQKERPVLEQTLRLLQPLGGDSSGPSPLEPIRSVRNPHRKVPTDIPTLQKEIRGLENVVLNGNGRKLVSQGPVVARKKSHEEDGHLFLFSDLLLYCKHNAAEDNQLFTFSRAFRLHQVIVRNLPETERASAAGFRVSAFAMPSHHDLTFFASNARDKDRWSELIRKKQTDLRLRILKESRKFNTKEVVKGTRRIPVVIALTNEILMKVVPETDSIIASYDFQQLAEWRQDEAENMLVFDFNGAMENEYQKDLVVTLAGDGLNDIAAEVERSKAAGERAILSNRAALPSFRPSQPNLVSKPVEEPVAQQQRALAPVDDYDDDAGKQEASNQNADDVNVRPPPPTFVPKQETDAVVEAEIIGSSATVDAPSGVLILDQRRGPTADAWEAYGANRRVAKSDAHYAKRQRAKERRQRMRDQASEGRGRRRDEDKKLFMMSLDNMLKQTVEQPDEASLRPAESLTDKQVMDLQRRATVWKRQNKMLKELLYTQYVSSNK